MKILLVHNFYGSSAPSGENQVFIAEKNLLLSRGHDVKEFTRHSDEIRGKSLQGLLKGALATPWNPWVAREIKREVDRFKPDVVHVHNTFPLISPAIFHAIGQTTARVLTLHNYRLLCPAAIPMRQGHVCTDCLDARSAWPALRHGCYRGSRVATLPLAINVGLHRLLGTWTKQVDAFIALSEFQRNLMVNAGLPGDKVHIKPNFFPRPATVVPWQQRKPYVVFSGRLSKEKGVITLLRAWRLWGINAPELRIVGDGELRGTLEEMATGLPVRFMGQLNKEAAQLQIANAQLLILPSEWFETFGLVLGEAFSYGTPVAVSNIGPLPSIVGHNKNGVVFEPTNPESLLNVVRAVWESKSLLQKLAKAARTDFEDKYTKDVNYRSLMMIYQHAINAQPVLEQAI
jgi:glycosyltransferase involved in cell wall biosynthesis